MRYDDDGMGGPERPAIRILEDAVLAAEAEARAEAAGEEPAILDLTPLLRFPAPRVVELEEPAILDGGKVAEFRWHYYPAPRPGNGRAA